ncbi:MAG: MmgE/PrpD family protein [Halobacteriota archaeon]
MTASEAEQKADASIADRLARYSIDTSVGDLDDAVLDAIGKRLLDWIGLVVGGASIAESSDSVRAGVETLAIGAVESGDADGTATVVPSGERIAADRAALLNGTYAHSLDFDDTHRASSLHPGAPVFAAALAAAEANGATTDELLASIAVGYDVTCRLGQAVNPDNHYGRGFHITATCGTFGATAAAGRLWGLDSAQLSTSFGINGSQAAGSLQFLENGAWNKRLHPGLAASRAIQAVSLADAGFRGASRPIVGEHGFFAGYTEDPDSSVLEEIDPGRSVVETALKPYPCCRYTHAAIDGLLAMATEHDIDPESVRTVEVDLPASGVTLTGEPIDAKRRPENFVNCQFSMPFAAALALRERDAGLGAFLDAQDSLDDQGLRSLMDRVSVVTTDRTRSRFPDVWAAGVRIETETGTYDRFVEHALGEPERPMSWTDVETKFSELTDAAGVSASAQDAVVRTCHDIEDVEFEVLLSAIKELSTGE